MDELLLVLIGLTAGLTGAIAGLGGGFVVIPAMTFLFALAPKMIAGTSTLVLFVSSIASAAAFARQKRIDYQSAVRFAVAMLPGSLVGAFLTAMLQPRAFYLIFGCFLLSIAVFMMVRPSKPLSSRLRPTTSRSLEDREGNLFAYSFNAPVGLGIAFVTGFLSSMLGIGGGSVLVPTMVLLLGFPPHVATATSILTIVLSSSVSAASHLYLGHILFYEGLLLAVGAIVGGQVGARLAKRLRAQTIVRVFSVLLIIIAIRLIWQ